jgi:hypothetical protein
MITETKVTAYQTSDGEVFHNREDAERHEIKQIFDDLFGSYAESDDFVQHYKELFTKLRDAGLLTELPK